MRIKNNTAAERSYSSRRKRASIIEQIVLEESRSPIGSKSVEFDVSNKIEQVVAKIENQLKELNGSS